MTICGWSTYYKISNSLSNSFKTLGLLIILDLWIILTALYRPVLMWIHKLTMPKLPWPSVRSFQYIFVKSFTFLKLKFILVLFGVILILG